MNILEISNMTKDYGRFKLNDVSIDLPEGCIMGLVGENGAGKSTLLKAALGLVNRNAGEVRFRGETLVPGSPQMEEIGVVFDTLRFHETLTPSQIGTISAQTFRNWDEAAFREHLKRFDLPEKSKIKGFSKGMRMKLNLAVALSHKARLLLMDEPTAGLDPIARDELLDLFLDFVQDETHSILLSSHITSDLEKAADYITFLHKGKLLFTKPTYELQYNYRIVRCGEQDFRKLKEEKGAVWRKMDYNYEILLPEGSSLEKKYPNCSFDRGTIDEIMLLSVKGESK